MANKEEIIIEIGSTGDVEISVKGHRGKGCHALTKAIEDALGSTTSTKTTSEYAAAPVAAKSKVSQR